MDDGFALQSHLADEGAKPRASALVYPLQNVVAVCNDAGKGMVQKFSDVYCRPARRGHSTRAVEMYWDFVQVCAAHKRPTLTFQLFSQHLRQIWDRIGSKAGVKYNVESTWQLRLGAIGFENAPSMMTHELEQWVRRQGWQIIEDYPDWREPTQTWIDHVLAVKPWVDPGTLILVKGDKTIEIPRLGYAHEAIAAGLGAIDPEIEVRHRLAHYDPKTVPLAEGQTDAPDQPTRPVRAHLGRSVRDPETINAADEKARLSTQGAVEDDDFDVSWPDLPAHEGDAT